uniref:Uncharacterized protein n=1 Tax=Anguilla anguilla TaxID=7936 RepID=A0A0E9TBH6_ANGAN
MLKPWPFRPPPRGHCF